MSIHVTCSCGYSLRVKDKYAGQKGKCPGCGHTLRIPTLDSNAAAKPASIKPERSTPGSERRRMVRYLARSLFPRALPDWAGLDVAGLLLPAREPGHDYADCLQLQDGSWGVLAATANAVGIDGVRAALELRAATHALALGYSEPGVMLSLLNRAVVNNWPQEYSATMLLVRLDPQSRLLTYASAGHPTAYLLDPQGNPKWNLQSSDCPLGLLAQTMYGTSAPLRLDDGESLLLFSEGLLAAITGTPPGAAGVLRVAASHPKLSAKELVQSIQQQLSQEQPQNNDRTLLVVKAK